MPIAVRPRGIGLIIVAVMLFALAGFTRVGWLLLFDAVLWGTIIVSAVMPWLTIGNVSIRRRITGWQGKGLYDSPMAGDECDLEIHMENNALLPAVFVGAEYNFRKLGVESQKQRLFLAWLGRKGSYTTTTHCSFTHRGLYKLTDLKLETSAPFGMFRRRKSVSNPTEILVLPKVHPVAGLELLDNSGATSSYTMRARVGELITGSRNYVSGDPWHHVHWKNSARTGQPQVKEFEKTPDSAITIGLDVRPISQTSEDALEHAISLAASVGDYVCRSGGIVRLVAGGINMETTDANGLLRNLATMRPGDNWTLPSMMALAPPFSAVLMIIDEHDGAGIREAIRLSDAQRTVSAVVLTGFGEYEDSSNAVAGLAKAGVRVVECRPGEATQALTALGRQKTSSPAETDLDSVSPSMEPELA